MGLTEASAFKNLSIVSDDIANDSITSAKIVDGAIVNADINASAAIAGTKISPNFGSQNIQTSGDLKIIGTYPNIVLMDSDNDSDFRISNANGKLLIYDTTNSATRFTVNSDGHVDVTGNLDVGAGADVTGNLTVSGNTNLTGNVTVTGNSTFSNDINTNGNDIYISNGTLISADTDGAFADRSGDNIDHIWHNDTNSDSNTGWNFVSDGTYKRTGNAELQAGSIRCYSQDAMVFTNATDRTINDSDMNDPIHFDTIDLEKGGTNDSNSKSRITVSQDGIYLITCCLSGSVTTHSHGDGIAICLRKNGSIFPRESAFGVESFGSQDDMEWSFTFAITEQFSANDYLEVVFRNVDVTVQATLNKGYFCVTRLH